MRTMRCVVMLAVVGAGARVAVAAPTYGAGITTETPVQNSTTPVVLQGLDTIDPFFGDGLVRAGDTLAGRALASSPSLGFNNGLSEAFSFNAAAVHDDVVIHGGTPGAVVPFTMHVPFHAVFSQTWSSISYTTFVDQSRTVNGADFQASLFSPSTGAMDGRFVLRTLDNPDRVVTIGTAETNGGHVLARGGFEPFFRESPGDGITITHNEPLGDGGFMVLDRSQFPVTSVGSPFGPGVGFLRMDTVTLRGEITFTGMAVDGQPMTLSLVMIGSALAGGAFEQGATAAVNALNTFGVPQDGSVVFDLPAGYTADAPSLNVVNNVVAVPEVGTMGVLGVGVVGVMRRRRGGRGKE